MATAGTVEGVITRMREIDAALPREDGVGIFNRMYLAVTERIAATIDHAAGDAPRFQDMPAMAELDVRFANLWLGAYDADAGGEKVPDAWEPLFAARGGGRLPIQYAISGMNSHIEHDLPIAVVETCRSRGLEPDHIHADYEAVNDVLAEVESAIRRSFLDAVGLLVDDRIGPIAHLLSTWNIDKARDLAWVTAETLWALRNTRFLGPRFAAGLGDTVGMTSRVLLTPPPAGLDLIDIDLLK